MDEDKKKIIMIAIIVVCIAVAGLIVFRTTTGGGGGLDTYKGEMTYMLCDACENVWEMDLAEYYTFCEEHGNPLSGTAPAVPCPSCGEEAGYRAVKCEKCSEVFFYGGNPGDYADRCPSCGYSSKEAQRKR